MESRVKRFIKSQVFFFSDSMYFDCLLVEMMMMNQK